MRQLHRYSNKHVMAAAVRPKRSSARANMSMASQWRLQLPDALGRRNQLGSETQRLSALFGGNKIPLTLSMLG